MSYVEEQEESKFIKLRREVNGLLRSYALSTGEYFSELRRGVLHKSSG